MQNELTISELFNIMGFPHEMLELNKLVDVSHLGYEVRSRSKNNENTWHLIKSIIKKECTHSYIVPECSLTVSPMHLFWTRVNNSEPHWVEACGLVDCSSIQLLHETKGWIDVSVRYCQELTEILDIEVDDTHCYFTNGVLSHNTMYGDPLVAPGGKSIPFHASVRIRLSSGTQVKDKSGNVIGIHVIATIIKNKVAPPFRKCEFDILFGKGIVEHEYLFDELRSYCANNGPVKHEGNLLNIEGTSGWKSLTVVDQETGEVKLEKKFHKPDFEEIMNDPQYKPYVDKIIDTALTINLDNSQTTVGESPDTDSDEDNNEPT